MADGLRKSKVFVCFSLFFFGCWPQDRIRGVFWVYFGEQRGFAVCRGHRRLANGLPTRAGSSLSSPLRLRVQSRSRTRLRIAAPYRVFVSRLPRKGLERNPTDWKGLERYPAVWFPWVWKDILNFLAPTASSGRPPPHPKISGSKSLGLGLSGPLRLRVPSQSRMQLRIAASITFLLRACYKRV